MRLASGVRLGPYEIVGPLGAGGMGEVYKARDTRLERTVAIKILPSRLSSDPQVRGRFRREARVISSLDHPHICALYDVGHDDGIDFLVMQYLEGETLATRMARGVLPLPEALQYAIEISDALAKAHRLGIVHRDLKPSNVMLTKSGAKLLDFGIAKVRPHPSDSSTPVSETSPLTATEGVIPGTLQYMAPEQIEGKEADARSDIWALGCVLYEMLTGQRAFEGATHASLIAAILDHQPPPPSRLATVTPPLLDEVVRTCLAKDPDQRFQHPHDVLMMLRWIDEGGQESFVPAAPKHRRLRLAVALGVSAALLALAFVVGLIARRPAETRAMRFAILPSKDVDVASTPVISPDGRRLAFVAAADGKQLLWIRSLDSLIAQTLSGTEGAESPFWSPDSRHVGFFAGPSLKRISASGGPPQTLCSVELGLGRGGAWNTYGDIIFASGARSELHRVSAAGGVPARLTTPDLTRGETSHRWPYFLPDGRHFLFLVRSDQPAMSGIHVASLDSADRRLVIPADSSGQYARPGYVLFVRERTLMAQAFDGRRLEATGEPVPIAEQIRIVSGADTPTFSVSHVGVLAYGAGPSLQRQLAWFDRTGRLQEQVGPPSEYFDVRLSPDDKRAAVQIGGDIWVMDLTRGIPSRFTFVPANNDFPVWSPDGSRIAFHSNRTGVDTADLYVKVSAGAGSEEMLLQSKVLKTPTDWSSDGRLLLYQVQSPDTQTDLWSLPLKDGRTPVPFLQTAFRESQGRFSPDVRWVAYTSNESGRNEIYVQSFPEPGGKWQISANGGAQANWRADGKELFYLDPDGRLMAVDVTTRPALEFGTPRPLFQTRIDSYAASNRYGVSTDGQRFFMSVPAETVTSMPITLLLNWTAAVKAN